METAEKIFIHFVTNDDVLYRTECSQGDAYFAEKVSHIQGLVTHCKAEQAWNDTSFNNKYSPTVYMPFRNIKYVRIGLFKVDGKQV
jgi:hypothetical protein